MERRLGAGETGVGQIFLFAPVFRLFAPIFRLFGDFLFLAVSLLGGLVAAGGVAETLGQVAEMFLVGAVAFALAQRMRKAPRRRPGTVALTSW